VNEPAPAARSRLVLGLLLALYALVVLRTAWLCDDAYITYRTVDNWLAGLGPRWNPAERVQAYTHPLWMFAIAAGTGLTGNVYWTALAASLASSLGAVGLVAARLARSRWNAVAVVVLTLSSAFVDYSTSGLENPLTHLLLALFLHRFLCRPLDAANLAGLSLLASLAALNRLDTLLLYAPALAFAVLRFRSWRGLAIVAAGFAPLAAWELFSLVYYGFPFPNTAYAKLKLYLPRDEVVLQGVRYLANSLRLDPLALGTLAAAGGLAFLRGPRAERFVFAGAVLYVAYVVAVGGDFMAGRMLTAPLFAGAVLLARAEPLQRARRAVAALAVLLGIGFASPHPSFLAGIRENVAHGALIGAHGIADERRYYEPFTALSSYAVHGGVPANEWTVEGEQARARGVPLALMSYVGFFGFAAGPGVHVVDQHGLGEPLLARIPPPYRPDWRIGHVWRALPEGYWETLRTGENRIADPGLAAYHEKLALITRGPLWSAERWRAIAGMALGRYERWIDVNRYRFPPTERLAQASLAEPFAANGGAERAAPVALTEAGADVVLPAPWHARRLELGAGADDAHALVFFRGDRDLAIVKRPPRPGAGAGLAVFVVEVPPAASEAGYDRVRVLPYGGDGRYALGHVRVFADPARAAARRSTAR
jgi:arabinofuranosyltransferase